MEASFWVHVVTLQRSRVVPWIESDLPMGAIGRFSIWRTFTFREAKACKISISEPTRSLASTMSIVLSLPEGGPLRRPRMMKRVCVA